MPSIFSKGQFSTLFNSVKTHIFQFGDQVKGRNGVVIQRDARLVGGGGRNITDITLDILRDPCSQEALDRLMETASTFKPIVEPGGEEDIDIVAADFIRDTYVKRDSIFQTAIESAAICKVTGVSAHENNYEKNSDGHIFIKSITPVDTDRLIYTANENSSDYVLRLETFKHPTHGELPPKYKIVDFKYYSVYINNPYGFGVGSQLIDVIRYKERMVELWVRISERYATPIKVARVPSDAIEEEITEFFEHFKKMSEGSTFVLPPDFDLEVIDISSTGVEKLLVSLIDYADRQIFGLITGEYLTGREISNGAQARDEIATNITNRKAFNLLKSIAGRLNETTFKWLTAFNFPNAQPPTLRFEPETDLDKLANRLLTLKQLGIEPDPEWIAEMFDIQLKEKQPLRGFGNRLIDVPDEEASQPEEV